MRSTGSFVFDIDVARLQYKVGSQKTPQIQARWQQGKNEAGAKNNRDLPKSTGIANTLSNNAEDSTHETSMVYEMMLCNRFAAKDGEAHSQQDIELWLELLVPMEFK